jgi:hypothetical protein
LRRAPDASQKGCSLNVKANFVETKNPPTPFSNGGEDDVWDAYARQDLELSLASIKAPANLQKTKKDQRVLMVLSANIPITFLYPAFMCFYRGAKEVAIALPSTRVNDPTSDRVRKQIETLVEEISPSVAPMHVNVLDSKDVSFGSLEAFDTVVVFGTDETLATFKERIPQGVELIGLGSIQNAMAFDDRKSEELVQICSRWLGRGCLTPVALVADESIDSQRVAKFAQQFDEEFSARLKAASLESPFVHRHRLIEIMGFYTDAIVHRGRNTFVADLRQVEKNTLSCSGGGSGLVYVISPQQASVLNLSFYNPEPGFIDQHQGKLWSEWL